MRVFVYLARRYPWESAVVVLCLALAHLLEGIGVTVALPTISIVADQQNTAGASDIERRVLGLLADLGIDGLGELLGVIAVFFWLKAIVMLFSKKRVGYTVAHVATDLRLGLLQSLLRTSWSYYTRQPVGA